MNIQTMFGLLSIPFALVACNKIGSGSTTYVQKGIAPGKVAVGFIELLADPAQCAVVTDDPAGKDKFQKNGENLAKMLKGKIVPACPTENVMGTCDAGFGLLGNYYGPKWTAETAKKDCAAAKQKWVD